MLGLQDEIHVYWEVLRRHVLANGARSFKALIELYPQTSHANWSQMYRFLLTNPYRTKAKIPWSSEEDEFLIQALNEESSERSLSGDRLRTRLLGRSGTDVNDRRRELSDEIMRANLVVPRRRNYYVYEDELAVLNQLVSPMGRARKGLTIISGSSRIPPSTLCTWRKIILEPGPLPDDPDERSQMILERLHHADYSDMRVMFPEIEALFDDFVDEHIGLLTSISSLRMLALNFMTQDHILMARLIHKYQRQHRENEIDFIRQRLEDEPQSVENELPHFGASWSWVHDYCHRKGLILKVPHQEKRGQINPEEVATYLREVKNAYDHLGPDHVINMDETHLVFNPSPKKVLAKRGEKAKIYLQTDDKEGVTLLCAVTMHGRKCTPWVIAKGLTKGCEAKFGTGDFITAHSASGWCNETVMLDYLQWVHEEVLHRKPGALIMDCYGSHWTQTVVDRAQLLGIQLIKVPANGTGLYQPCDIGIFGPVKKMYYKESQAWRVEHQKVTADHALAIFMRVWGSIRKDVVVSAWRKIQDLGFHVDPALRLPDTPDVIPNQAIPFITTDTEAQDAVGRCIRLRGTLSSSPRTVTNLGLMTFAICSSRSDSKIIVKLPDGEPSPNKNIQYDLQGTMRIIGQGARRYYRLEVDTIQPVLKRRRGQ